MVLVYCCMRSDKYREEYGMVQKVRVQDGVIVYTATEDDQPLEMGVRGSVTVTQSLTVGNDPSAESYIRTQGTGDLVISANLSGSIKLRTDTGGIELNGMKWPVARTPNIGSFLSVAQTGVLNYNEFPIGVVSANTLSSTDLNAQYPTALPGQFVLGPSVLYFCTGLTGNRWRIISATVA